MTALLLFLVSFSPFDLVDPATLMCMAPEPVLEAEAVPDSSNGYCCRVCRRGCACGDSCIRCDYTCRVGPGCACDG